MSDYSEFTHGLLAVFSGSLDGAMKESILCTPAYHEEYNPIDPSEDSGETDLPQYAHTITILLRLML